MTWKVLPEIVLLKKTLNRSGYTQLGMSEGLINENVNARTPIEASIQACVASNINSNKAHENASTAGRSRPHSRCLTGCNVARNRTPKCGQ